MPKPRSQAREMARRIWMDTQGRRHLTDIARECGVSPELVRKWKAIDHWSLDDKKKSDSAVTEPPDFAPNGNGNGNATRKTGNGHRVTRIKRKPGNPYGNPNLQPAPAGNKRAVTAGEYETILFDTLSDTEKKLASACLELPATENLLRTLVILTVRERRIMERIHDRLAMSGDAVQINGSEMFAIAALNMKAEGSSGTVRKKQQVAFEHAVSFITDLEDALTRVQNSKARVLDMLHRMQRDAILTDFERRKVEVLEQRTAIEQKRFDFEYSRGSGSGQNDPIAGWLEVTHPTEESISAMFTAVDGEESP